MRFEIRYESEYRYDRPVVGNLNRLRMRPASGGVQRSEHFDVRMTPDGMLHRYADLFGNDVVEVLVPGAHQILHLEVDALVATTSPIPPPESPFAHLRGEGYRETAGPYLGQTLPEIPDLGGLVAEVRQGSPAETLRAVTTLLGERLTYTPGATNVDSTVADFLAAGGGVCQDFAHLALMLLREHDIAARYVSGYFYTVPAGSGEDVASAEVQTHAWVEALLPVPGDDEPPVWFAVDPTNGIVAGESHVKIGHGRMYSDVPPVEGTFAGDAASTVESHVTMTRLETPELQGA